MKRIWCLKLSFWVSVRPLTYIHQNTVSNESANYKKESFKFQIFACFFREILALFFRIILHYFFLQKLCFIVFAFFREILSFSFSRKFCIFSRTDFSFSLQTLLFTDDSSEDIVLFWFENWLIFTIPSLFLNTAEVTLTTIENDKLSKRKKDS